MFSHSSSLLSSLTYFFVDLMTKQLPQHTFVCLLLIQHTFVCLLLIACMSEQLKINFPSFLQCVGA